MNNKNISTLTGDRFDDLLFNTSERQVLSGIETEYRRKSQRVARRHIMVLLIVVTLAVVLAGMAVTRAAACTAMQSPSNVTEVCGAVEQTLIQL